MTETAAPYGEKKPVCRNGNILLEAHTLVNNDRQDEYGPPAESFGQLAQLAQLWSVYLRHEITPHDVAMCMALLKINREAHKHKRDNLVDAAAYLALAADLEGWE